MKDFVCGSSGWAWFGRRAGWMALAAVGWIAQVRGEAESTVGVHEARRVYLSGLGADDAVAWDFKIDAGRRAGEAAKIPVPSCWELHGFGTYTYRSISDETGTYRTRFPTRTDWAGKRVFVVFEGVMADTQVVVNGVEAGAAFQGSFYRFEREVTSLLKEGGAENELTVIVRKKPRDVSLAGEAGDYWVYGGIFRPVYVEARPRSFIDDVALDAKADGTFFARVAVDGAKDGRVRCTIRDRDGREVGRGESVVADGAGEVRFEVKHVATWSDETPVLYRAEFDWEAADGTRHTTSRRFGFRTYEFRAGEGFFVNGRRVFLRGVNRHSFEPDSGRTLSREDNLRHALLIQDCNANAVRMHYPADEAFADFCDEMGIYQFVELCASWRPMETARGEALVRAMMKRDQHRASVIAWANGNEGGWNPENDGLFARRDPQARPVLHTKGKTGIMNCPHYPRYDEVVKAGEARDVVTIFTEALHGHYDGGAGAGLEDYWRAVRASKNIGGLYLWALWDEGVARSDRGGAIDVPTINAADGFVGPRGEREGSFYTIRELWSPVQLGEGGRLPATFDGELRIENRYHTRGLAGCVVRWALRRWDARGNAEEGPTGEVAAPNVAAGGGGRLRLELPDGWRRFDALETTVRDADGRALAEWSWALHGPAETRERVVAAGNGTVRAEERDGRLTLSAAGRSWSFDLASGRLVGARRDDVEIPFGNGPRVLAQRPRAYAAKAFKEPEQEKGGAGQRAAEEPGAVTAGKGDDGEELRLDGAVRVEHGPGEEGHAVRATAAGARWSWTVRPGGALELQASYEATGSFDFHGVAFDLPETAMRSREWMGLGPYRVWKNRERGARFGVWKTDYNDTVTGVSWAYPEFRGIFGELHWARLALERGTLVIATETPGVSLHQYHVEGPAARKLHPLSPKADLALLKAIPAMGSKYHGADAKGPGSRPATASGEQTLTVWFDIEK